MASVLDGITASRSNALRGLDSAGSVTPEERVALDRMAASRQGEFKKGLRRAAYNASDTTDAFVGQLAESFAPDFTARQFAKVDDSLRTRPKGLEQEVQSFRDVDSVGSAASFASGALGEGITSVAGIVAGGMAARLGLGTALRLGAKGKDIAQYGGGVAAMLPQEGGETALTLRNNPEAMANTTPLERTGLTLGKGTIAAAMESIVPNLVFTNAISGTARRIAAGGSSAAANVGRKAVGGAVGEFATEGAQELTGQAAENIATSETGYDFEQALEAAVRGSITGGVLGGAGGTVQAARSNIDAAAETALEKTKPAATSAMNKAVEGLDNLIRNPEQSGVDMTDATLGALAEASARAQSLGAEVADKAGPAAATGMDAIAGLKGRMDEAIMGQLTPENVSKYRELTKNIRLLQPSEYEILRDAMETGNAEQINEAVGSVAKLLKERVPRGTLDGLQALTDWGKRFGRGVTKAAREGRKASQAYASEDITRFRGFLSDQYPNVLRTMDSTDASDQLARVFMAYRDDAQLLNAGLRPQDQEAIDSFERQTGVPLEDMLVSARNWRNDNITSREKKDAFAESTGASQISRVTGDMERILTPDLQQQYEDAGIKIGPGATESDGFIRDDEGNQINEEDTRRTPFNSLPMVRRLLAADNQRPNPRNALPSTMTSDVLTPQQIGKLIQGRRSDNIDGKWTQAEAPLTDEQIGARITEDGKGYRQNFNTINITAQAGTPNDRAGSRENFEGFVPEFTGSSSDLKIQGYRLLSAISALNSNGIDIPRSEIAPALLEEFGLDVEGDAIHIAVELDPNTLSNETQVQVGRKESTIGDLNGANRGARALEAQLALLGELGDNPNGHLQLMKKGGGKLREMAIARANKGLDSEAFAARIEKDPDLLGQRVKEEARRLRLTATALNGGLYGYAARQEELQGNDLTQMRGRGLTAAINNHSGGFYAELENRMSNAELRARDAQNRQTLKEGLRNKLFTPNDVRDHIEALGGKLQKESVEGPDSSDTQIEFDEGVIPPGEEFQATDWAEAQGVEFTDTYDLRRTLEDFERDEVAQYELRQEAFEDTSGVEEPTVDEQFEARRNEGLVTNASPYRIDQQNDAAVRAARPAPSTQAQVDQAQIDADNADIEAGEAIERQADIDETVAETQQEGSIAAAEAAPGTPVTVTIGGTEYQVISEEKPNKNGNIAWNRRDGVHMVRGLTKDRILKYLREPEIKSAVQKRQAAVREEVSRRFEEQHGDSFLGLIEGLAEQQLKQLVVLHETRHTQQRAKHGSGFAKVYRERPADFEFDANRFALRELGLIDTGTAQDEQVAEEQTPPPQEPPQEPPGPSDTPPPPPPDNAARAKFIETVKRLLGNRTKVEFDAEGLGDGIAAVFDSTYGLPLEDTTKALKAIREGLRTDKAALEMSVEDREKVDDLRTDAQIQRSIDKLMVEEQAYLNDLAVRGTIRVAAGMEAQAGLAEHEAFHAAFEVFFGADNAADRKAITTAFTRGVLAKRLQKYFAGNEEVLAVIDPTSKDFRAEEAAAYAFQVFLHDPGALQMGEKVAGIFNRFLAYLQRLVGYKTYEQKAQMVFNDLNSGRRSERGVSVLRDNPNIEKAMLAKSQDFARAVGTGFMHMYDTVLSSTYSRLEGSGNVAMAQIARLGYNETGQEGNGMLQLSRLATTQWSNRLKEALHTLDGEELNQLNRAMMLGEDLTGKLAQPQKRLRAILADVHRYQTESGIEELGFLEDYFPMIWNPDKVAAEPKENFIAMLQQEKYAEAMGKSRQTADEIYESIASFESRGHEFQGIFNEDGEPVADSSNRRTLGFIDNEDRVKYMEDDLITTMAHYLNQAVRHAEYVRAYGQNGSELKRLMGEITGTYGGTQTDVDLTKDYMDGLLGNKEVGMSRELKDLYGAATVYQNVRLLPLSVFSSLVDPLGVAVRTQSMGGAFDTFAYSLRNMFTDFRNKNDWTPDMWEQYADDMGTIDMSGTIKAIDKIYTGVTLRGKTREINDTFFKWNLLNGWVKNNHIGATKAAQLYLRRNAEGEMFTGKMRDENLKEAGVSAEDIVYDETLGRIKSTAPEILGYADLAEMELKASEDEIKGAREQADRIQQAIHKIVRQSMIQPSSAEMPGWMSNPYLAPIAHLKTFVFGFNATILQRLLYEAQRGNYNPIYYAVAYVPGMIAADFIKGFAGNGGEEPEWKKNWGFGDYVGYGVERSGLMGTSQFFADMSNDVTRGGGGFESLSGPSIEQGLDLMSAMKAKTSEPTATWMTNALPANALYDQWLRDN